MKIPKNNMLALKFILIYLRFQLKRNNVLNFDNNSCKNIWSYPLWFLQKDCYRNPDFHSTVPQILRRHGYKMETYNVPTDDGYVLKLFHIPPKIKTRTKYNHAIFLLHGLATDSATFVNVAKRSLAFGLSNLGYDVWLGNLRGTHYSKDHKTVKNNKDYWDFSLDHMVDDVRKSLQLVYHVTNNRSMIFVGHSMGTTLMFMYASEYPEEANKLVKGIIAMAPVVYFDVDKHIVPLMNFAPLIARIFRSHDIYQMPKNTHKTEIFYRNLCRIHPYLCTTLFNLQYGKSSQLAPEDLILFWAAFQDAICVKVLEHYGQMYRRDSFHKFDYGTTDNLRIYGSSQPPEYNLTQITVPVFIYFGNRDTLIGKRGLIKLYQELGSKRKTIAKVPLNSDEDKDQFNHVDFTYAKDLKRLFYDDLFAMLSREFDTS